jgi:DNA-binding NtrC family response regulator
MEDGIDFAEVLSSFERKLITHAMEKAHGTIAEAARLLKMNRTTLHEKMRRLGLL